MRLIRSHEEWLVWREEKRQRGRDREKIKLERWGRALRMRKSGMTFKEVSENLGVCLQRAREIVYRAARSEYTGKNFHASDEYANLRKPQRAAIGS